MNSTLVVVDSPVQIELQSAIVTTEEASSGDLKSAENSENAGTEEISSNSVEKSGTSSEHKYSLDINGVWEDVDKIAKAACSSFYSEEPASTSEVRLPKKRYSRSFSAGSATSPTKEQPNRSKSSDCEELTKLENKEMLLKEKESRDRSVAAPSSSAKSPIKLTISSKNLQKPSIIQQNSIATKKENVLTPLKVASSSSKSTTKHQNRKSPAKLTSSIQKSTSAAKKSLLPPKSSGVLAKENFAGRKDRLILKIKPKSGNCTLSKCIDSAPGKDSCLQKELLLDNSKLNPVPLKSSLSMTSIQIPVTTENNDSSLNEKENLSTTAANVEMQKSPGQENGLKHSLTSTKSIKEENVKAASSKTPTSPSPQSKVKKKKPPDGDNESPRKRIRGRIDAYDGVKHVPFTLGWRREIVIRGTADSGGKRQSDVYYYAPDGCKLRSMVEIGKYLEKHPNSGLTCGNFTYFKEPIYHPPEEVTRQAIKRFSDSAMMKTSPKLSSPVLNKKVHKKRPFIPDSASPTKKIALIVPKRDPQSAKTPKKEATQSSETPSTPKIILTIRKESSNEHGLASQVRMVKRPKIKFTPLRGKSDKVKEAHIVGAKRKFTTSTSKIVSPARPPCSLYCLGQIGKIPSLMCNTCLCMFHPACVGFTDHATSLVFECKQCQRKNKQFSLPDSSPLNNCTLTGNPVVTIKSEPPDPIDDIKLNENEYSDLNRSTSVAPLIPEVIMNAEKSPIRLLSPNKITTIQVPPSCPKLCDTAAPTVQPVPNSRTLALTNSTISPIQTSSPSVFCSSSGPTAMSTPVSASAFISVASNQTNNALNIPIRPNLNSTVMPPLIIPPSIANGREIRIQMIKPPPGTRMPVQAKAGQTFTFLASSNNSPMGPVFPAPIANKNTLICAPPPLRPALAPRKKYCLLAPHPSPNVHLASTQKNVTNAATFPPVFVVNNNSGIPQGIIVMNSSPRFPLPPPPPLMVSPTVATPCSMPVGTPVCSASTVTSSCDTQKRAICDNLAGMKSLAQPTLKLDSEKTDGTSKPPEASPIDRSLQIPNQLLPFNGTQSKTTEQQVTADQDKGNLRSVGEPVKESNQETVKQVMAKNPSEIHNTPQEFINELQVAKMPCEYSQKTSEQQKKMSGESCHTENKPSDDTPEERLSRIPDDYLQRNCGLSKKTCDSAVSEIADKVDERNTENPEQCLSKFQQDKQNEEVNKCKELQRETSEQSVSELLDKYPVRNTLIPVEAIVQQFLKMPLDKTVSNSTELQMKTNEQSVSKPLDENTERTEEISGKTYRNTVITIKSEPPEPIDDNKQNENEYSDLNSSTSAMYNSKMRYMMCSFESLLKIFSFLPFHDLLRASQVCRTWNQISSLPQFWDKISLKGIYLKDWEKFAQILTKHGTSTLDFRGMKENSETWKKFSENIKNFRTIENLVFGNVPSEILRDVSRSLPHLKTITAADVHVICKEKQSETSIPVSALNISHMSCLKKLTKIVIRSSRGISASSEGLHKYLLTLSCLPNLRHLSLTSLKFVTSDDLMCLEDFKKLEELELGDCTGWDYMAFRALSKLEKLRYLKLENGGDIPDRGLSEALCQLKCLEEVHLVLFKIANNLGKALKQMPALSRLAIWPVPYKEVPPVPKSARGEEQPPEYPCGGCTVEVQDNQRGLQCEACLKWFHARCGLVSSSEYRRLGRSSDSWICPNCDQLSFQNQGGDNLLMGHHFLKVAVINYNVLTSVSEAKQLKKFIWGVVDAYQDCGPIRYVNKSKLQKPHNLYKQVTCLDDQNNILIPMLGSPPKEKTPSAGTGELNAAQGNLMSVSNSVEYLKLEELNFRLCEALPHTKAKVVHCVCSDIRKVDFARC